MYSGEGLPQLGCKIVPVVINTTTESAPFLHNVTISFVPLMMGHFRRFKTLRRASNITGTGNLPARPLLRWAELESFLIIDFKSVKISVFTFTTIE